MHNFFDNNGLPISDISFEHLDKAPLVINIGRQLGSGGRTIGKILARELGLLRQGDTRHRCARKRLLYGDI